MKEHIIKKIPRNAAVTVALIAILFSVGVATSYAAKKAITNVREYRITPHDTLDIQIYPQTDLNTILSVDANGYIFFSFLGYVEVGGLTPDQAALRLTELLEKDYLVDPRIIVKIKDSRANIIIIMGEVVKPGTLDYKLNGMTLMEAISEAGGFSGIAWINGTKIIRSVDGKETSFKVKVGDILNGKGKDVVLQPGDIIVVPESFF